MGAGEIAIRLGAATLAGSVIGFRFALRQRPAGLRTHALTTLAAAMFCLVALRMAGAGAGEVARVMQGIAQGLGFIGAAAVLRRDGRVEGVANAASLWITAAIGCECAVGDVRIALCIAVYVAVLDYGAHRLERRVLMKHRQTTGDPPVTEE